METIETTTKIDAILRDAVAAGHVPGVVALATTATDTMYEGAFGHRAAGAAAMTLDTVFWWASMTKAIVSLAAMQLVEQGRLSLDAPIADVLPRLADRQVLTGFDDAGAPLLRPAAGPVTLRHLLTHTAGYGYDMWNPEIGQWLRHAGVSRQPADWDTVARQPLLFDPGTRWNYGINTDFVGKAVEAVSGLTLDAYLAEHVFAPLGMRDSGVTLSEDQVARRAKMHFRAPDGGLTAMEFPVGGGPSFFMGGGALCGTGPDYLRFLRAMLGGAAGLLRPETWAEMSRNHIGDLLVQPMLSAFPAMSNDAEFFPGMAKQWSLGFLVNRERAPTGRAAGSLAWAGLANTYYWIDPTNDVAGVILMQILPFADAKALDLFTAFERAVYDELAPAT